MKLRTEIKAERQRWRECIFEVRLYGRIGRADFSRIVEFIVENRHGQRAIICDENRRRAMRGDGNGVEARLFDKSGKAFQEKAPQSLDVIMWIGAIAQHRIGDAVCDDFFAACRIKHNDFSVCFAYIQNGNALHGM